MDETQILAVLIDDVIEGDRLRQADPADVRRLSLSLAESKDKRLITPIKVRPHPALVGKYLLVAGSTRLAAAKLLQWPMIDAVVKAMTDEEAALEEIDENLYRSDLTASDLTFFMKRRLEMFEFQGGKLRRGRDFRKSAKLADLTPRDADRYYREVEEKFGMKRRTAERLVRRARNIPDALWAVMKAAKKPPAGALLDKIAALQPEQRSELEALVVGESLKITEALRRIAGTRVAEAKPVEAMLRLVRPSWDAWSARDRAAFIKKLKAATR